MAQWYEYGRATTPEGDELVRNESVTVGTSSVVLATARKRQEFAVINNSTAGQIITICRGTNNATAGKGVPLGPGTMWIESNGEGYKCCQSVVTAISNAAAGTVCVMER